MKKKILGVSVALGVMACCILVNVSFSNKVIADNAKEVKESRDDEVQERHEDIPNTDVEKEAPVVAKKIAVVYFSQHDDTRTISEYIRDGAKGSLFEIVPEEEYSEDDIAYTNSNSRSAKEFEDSKSRPEIKDDINLDGFDVVYLGFPIWNNDVPRIILSFIDETNLSGKTVIPFSIGGEDSIDNSVSTLKKYKNDIKFVDGKKLNNNKDEVVGWINSLKY